MKLLSKIAAGTLLAFGSLILLVVAITLFDPEETPKERSDLLAAAVIFGIPPAAFGSWLLWRLGKNEVAAEQERLRNIFLQTLEEHDGSIHLMEFAIAAGLSGEVAKYYLDEKAKEFSADFQVDEQGNVYYSFPFRQIAE